MMVNPHPRSTDPLRIVGTDLVIDFDRSGDPILPTAFRGGTVIGIFCEGDQWDEAALDAVGTHTVWDDGLAR